MKVLFAALVLFLQFQPALGAAACLDLTVHQGKQECSMLEQGMALRHTFSESATRPAPNCALVSVCAPAPLAVPVSASRVETAFVLQVAPAIAGDTRPLDVFSAPPFRPPRV
jgi:hypothetical protein